MGLTCCYKTVKLFYICTHITLHNDKPKHFDECRNAARLKYRQQSLTVMWDVVQGTSSAASSLRVQSTSWHGSQQCGYHLWWVHDGVAACLLLWQLVDHCDGLANHHLVFIVQQLYQLGDRPDCQVGIILTAFQWKHQQQLDPAVVNTNTHKLYICGEWNSCSKNIHECPQYVDV